MIKKWFEKKKSAKEKLRLDAEKEKHFFDGLKEHIPTATDNNVVLLKRMVKIAEEFRPRKAPVTTTDLTLGDDLGLDSMNILEFIMAVEEEFDTEILHFDIITEKSTLWDVFVLLHYCIFRWEEKME